MSPSQTTRLRCSGHTALGSVSYTWWKGNRPVEEVELLAGRVRVLQDGHNSVLVITEVHRDDAGVYLCQLSNQEGEEEEEEVEAEISVLEEAARVVFTPRQVHLRLGEAGTVPCYIRPSFYLATWTRDNASLFSMTADQSSWLRIDGKSGWLEWSEVREEARGEYRCQAYNRMGTAGQTLHFPLSLSLSLALHDILFDVWKIFYYSFETFPRGLVVIFYHQVNQIQ